MVAVWLAAVLLTGCRPDDPSQAADNSGTATADAAAASDALVAFFDKLAAGRYGEAVEYYGGSYDTLLDWNPDTAPADQPTLWRNGCSINGLVCLPTRTVTTEGTSDERTYLFAVEFTTREGDLFVLGPCCGVTETEQPPVSSFSLRVSKGDDGRFRVIDLPPYRP